MSGKKLFIFSALLTISCAKKTDKEMSSTSGSGIVASTGSLNVVISTAWEDVPGEFETHATCSVSGTADTPESETCTVEIPEAQLHYSKLKFDISRTGDCALLNFYPYRYRKSNSATYTPIAASASVDCSKGGTTDDLPECWGGAAVELVPSFPDFTGLFTTGLTMEKIISSPNEKQEPGNRYVSNDKLDKTIDVLQVPNDTDPDDGIDDRHEGYVADTMSDYVIQCKDKWSNDLSIITVEIIDFDGSSPNTNDILSWQ